MALKIPIPFPIFVPPVQSPNNPNPTRRRPPSELRFSRWNNANAEKFNERRRTLQEIEDDLRRDRRFGSADRIARYYDSATPSSAETFKSAGTPSFPSKPSIPGKKSKYSKNPNPNPDPNHKPESQHPAFRRFSRTGVPIVRRARALAPAPVSRDAKVRIGEDGLSYVIDGAPFEFKYSYTETPKVKPLGLREEAYAPFGPATMPRPWTGRAPLPASKKKPREFDSFKLPPPHKKGVKPVQSPGPFLPGSGPKYVRTREEVLGDPLTKEEVAELIEGCKRTKRQLNMGRDGLTHNMLDNIHALWKRRRVCKIKCKGVCTVDMETVRQQLEERTGGKIIFSKGGVIYLFRGRNYNYKTRPRFPLMLWKPITPVYPRLVQRVPEGLTLEEAADMRKKGHKLIPICKLGKNGVYTNLVAHVREAFEECELARIDCQGMNGSDYRRIGAKLKDLVPCVLLSFANEHILMWRGRDWQPSLPKLDMNIEEANESNVENATSAQLPLQGEEATIPRMTGSDENPDLLNTSTSNNGSEVAGEERSEESLSSEYAGPLSSSGEVSNSIIETENISDIQSPRDDAVVSDNSVHTIKQSIKMDDVSRIEVGSGELGSVEEPSIEVPGSNTILPAIESAEAKLDSVEEVLIPNENQKVTLEAFQDVSEMALVNTPCTEGVLSLLQQALESGSAIILDYTDLDADIVYQKMVTFSQSAPPGPVFRHRLRKVKIKKSEVQEDEELDVEDLEPQVITTLPTKAGGEKKGSKPRTPRKIDFGEHLDNVVPQGSLRVDELAKLLA